VIRSRGLATLTMVQRLPSNKTHQVRACTHMLYEEAFLGQLRDTSTPPVPAQSPFPVHVVMSILGGRKEARHVELCLHCTQASKMIELPAICGVRKETCCWLELLRTRQQHYRASITIINEGSCFADVLQGAAGARARCSMRAYLGGCPLAIGVAE
jgi:hypothetical protein